MEDDQLQDGKVLPKSLGYWIEMETALSQGILEHLTSVSITKVGWGVSSLAGKATYIQP